MKIEAKNILEQSVEIIGWIQIFLSPFLISVIVAILIYVSSPTVMAILSSVFILIIGILAGVLLVNKIYKSKQGTMHFISRVSASPELDEVEKDIKK